MNDHSHSHDHNSRLDTSGRAFAIGVTLNLAFVAIEVGFGLWADSLALLADAGHNFSDVIGLLLAWGASVLARRPPSSRFTYGLRGTTILAALANAMLLLVAVGAIGWEALQRLHTPAPVMESAMIWVALTGVVVNSGTAILFLRGARQDLNIRGAFLHMATDAAVSLAVVLAGVGIATLGWMWIDPVISLVIAAVILAGTWGLLKESMGMALGAVPAGVDPEAVRSFLAGRPGVTEVHDLHIWAMSTSETALSAHLVMPDGHPGDAFLNKTADALEHHHGIGHVTLPIECADGASACALAPENVV